jgi:hypothetical protein
MTRSILAALASSVALTVLLGAGGCTASGVGDPCTPEEEYDPSFLGFNYKEVNVESRSFQCQTRLCLVNHFQGRVSCPYGQNSDGTPNAPATSCATDGSGAGCCIPGVGAGVTGKDPSTGMVVNPCGSKGNTGPCGAQVKPQCTDRTAADAVYCSCRCANINGKTDDGANYCTCPDGFSCTQLVSSIGAGNEGLTGAYCVKNKTQYDPSSSCTSGDCDPTLGNCGAAPGVTPH